MCQFPTDKSKQKPVALLTPPSEAELKERREALAAAFGILKGKGVFPEDGLEYQLEVRAEWR